ncbi:RNA-binding S4 domain-containing protein [Veillonella intestinalis]|uniref:RNA-binding S4 domain-containing protein n=1 Tax=Veillonella intestinalis TaxID=2941341 RepID=UPI00203CC7A0|nr:RNA-binding S4 domain-containing protein [Veillonella intestinalis]
MKTKKEPIQVEIHTPYIKLDQLLKFEQIIGTGGQVKFLLDDQKITVNGEICHEKRKKIYPDDIVEIQGIGTLLVIKEEADE